MLALCGGGAEVDITGADVRQIRSALAMVISSGFRRHFFLAAAQASLPLAFLDFAIMEALRILGNRKPQLKGREAERLPFEAWTAYEARAREYKRCSHFKL